MNQGLVFFNNRLKYVRAFASSSIPVDWTQPIVYRSSIADCYVVESGYAIKNRRKWGRREFAWYNSERKVTTGNLGNQSVGQEKMTQQALPFMEISGWNPVAEKFLLPKMTKMMAIGKHSHFGDASTLFWHFVNSFFSDILTMLWQRQRSYWWPIAIYLDSCKYITGDRLQLSDT